MSKKILIDDLEKLSLNHNMLLTDDLINFARELLNNDVLKKNNKSIISQLTRIADALENKSSIVLHGKISEHNKYSNNFVSKNEQS